MRVEAPMLTSYAKSFNVKHIPTSASFTCLVYILQIFKRVHSPYAVMVTPCSQYDFSGVESLTFFSITDRPEVSLDRP